MKSRWLAIPAGIALGLVAETGWPRGIDAVVVVADLGVGWLFIGGGYLTWNSRPANGTGILLMATGAAWFVATFHPPAAFLYCGPLAHLLLAHPTGRLAGWTSHVTVVAAYVTSALGAIMSVVGVG